MKKIIFMIMALVFGGVGLVSAYEQQGFNQYAENADGSITFWCQQSCVILLGEKGGNDMIKVSSGTLQGNGMWGYGYIVGQNVYAATLVEPNNYEWSFTDDPIYKQLPAGKKDVAFLVTGPLRAEGVYLEMRNRSVGDALGWTWKRFWNLEQIAPYSINLHYGPMVGGRSWPLFAFVLAIIAVVITLIVRKKFSWKLLLRASIIALMTLMIIGGARLTYDHGRNTYHNINKQNYENVVFELGNYIPVTREVREYLDLDNLENKAENCTIYAKAHSDWPFVAHWSSVYLRPCTVVKTGSMANYHLYFNVQPEVDTGAAVLSGINFIFYDLTQ